MIVNFQDISFDAYGKVEQPVITLKHMDGRIISTIGQFHSFSPTFRFNDVSEVSFEVPSQIEIDGSLVTPEYYDDIIGMRLVNIEPFGDFILSNIEISNNGVKEYKLCKGYSLEYAFNKKKINIPTGTYNFYNPADNDDTIIQIITEIVPDWKIGEIDRALIGRWRTFDNIDETLYSFMMGTLQETYNCLFLFDTINKKINVIEADTSASASSIHMSYDNLVKSAKITELADEVVTSLAGYGSGDNMSIAYVNPNGTDKIYNLDYLINHGDIDDELADRWLEYKDNCNFYQKIFSNLETMRIEKTSAYTLADAQLQIIQTDIDALETAIITSKADTTIDGWEENVAQLESDLEKLKIQFVDQEAVVKKYLTDKLAVQDQVKEITDICKLESFFTEDELVTLSMFFKEDSIVEDSFVVPTYSTTILGDNSSAITAESNSTLKIIGSVVSSSNIAEVFDIDDDGNYYAYDDDLNLNVVESDLYGSIDLSNGIAEAVAEQLNDSRNKVVYDLRGGTLEFTQTVSETINGEIKYTDRLISGSIVTASFQYNINNLSTYVDEDSSELSKLGYFLLTVTLRNAYSNDVFYQSMNITLSGMIKNCKPQITDEFIGFNIENGTFYNTAGVTEYQQTQVYQELYDYVEDALRKLSEPSYQFSVDSANFVFAPTFELFKNELTLGQTISLDLNGDSDEETIVHPILIEVTLNYDDMDNFSLTFSDKYKLSSPEFLFADLLGTAITTSKSLDLNKASYSSYVNSGAETAIESLANDSYDVAKKAIINSTNQGMEWNANGMYLRKASGNGYDPEQIAMINNMIAFTGDGWDSVKLAIGKFNDTNVGDTWGIAAPNITGTLFAGENLVIENTVLNDDGTKIYKQFKVDSTGAWLNNSALYFSSDSTSVSGSGGKILLDPNYGFAAGNLKLFSGDNTNIKPSFLDEDGNIEYEDVTWTTVNGDVVTTGQIPVNTSFYFDINNNTAYFKGDIYATNGYFSGVINATNGYFSGTIDASNIIADTLNGEVIKTGTLSGSTIANGTINASDKLTGDVNAEQLYKNVISAINEYVDFQNKEGQKVVVIDSAVIDNLDASKITSGSLSSNIITANVIEAINNGQGIIKADKIEAGSILSKGIIVTGDNGKLAIVPEYGIIAGNNDLFEIDDNNIIVNQTFIKDGKLQFNDGEPAPKNTSFYFDINTGKAYFSGSLSASDIQFGKLSSEYLSVSDGFITSAMIGNATITSTKIQEASITSALIAEGAVMKTNIGQAQIDTSHISSLKADIIEAGTISASKLVLVSDEIDEETGAYRTSLITALNASTKLGVDSNDNDIVNSSTVNKLDGAILSSDSIDAGDKLTGDIQSEQIYKNVIEAINRYVKFQTSNGANIVTMDNAVIGKLNADKIDVSDLSAFNATIGGFKITSSALHSLSKTSIDNINAGVYLGLDGISVGNGALNGMSISPFTITSNGEVQMKGKKSSFVFDPFNDKISITADSIMIKTSSSETLDDNTDFEDVSVVELINDAKEYAIQQSEETTNSLSELLNKELNGYTYINGDKEVEVAGIKKQLENTSFNISAVENELLNLTGNNGVIDNIKSDISTINNALVKQDSIEQSVTTIQKYIEFVDGNIVLSADKLDADGNIINENEDKVDLVISYDAVKFQSKTKTLAWFKKNDFYVSSGVFEDQLRIGNFAFIPRTNGDYTGNLSLKLIQE